ncbi:MAG: oxidoreductase [Dehalococcoidia bacterium]|nr:MAG: oxidoreductase [Dehalococcoidia bacterium]
MKLRPLGRSGLQVSELILGAMQFGQLSDDDARAIIDQYLDAGGNCIDTANVYGGGASEEQLGRLLGAKRRAIVLATKVRGPIGPGPLDVGLSRRHILDQVDASLRRLRTDWIDLYQIHRWDDSTPIEETLDALADCVRAGKVRYLGCSNLTGWQLGQSWTLATERRQPAWISLQPEYSLLRRDIERELIPACQAFGLGIIPWSPLGGGLLTGKYRQHEPPPPGSRGDQAQRSPFASRWNARLNERTFRIIDTVRAVADECRATPAQVALRWVMDRPGITAPIIGARTRDQLADTLGALALRLSPEATAQLDAASAIDLGYPYDSPGFARPAPQPTAVR